MIDKKLFKQTIHKILTEQYTFKKVANVWQKQINDYWVKVELQKSNFSNSYYINLITYKEKYVVDNKKRITWVSGTISSMIRIRSGTEPFSLDDNYSEKELYLELNSLFIKKLKKIVIALEKNTSWDTLLSKKIICL